MAAHPAFPEQATPSVKPAESDLFRQHMGKISRQSSVFFAGTIFTAGAGYLFKIYLARTLGAEALGTYALGMTIVGFLGIFNALGLPHAAVRYVSVYSATGKTEMLRSFLRNAALLLSAGNVLLAGVLLAAGPGLARRFYHTAALDPYLWMFALIMVLGAMNTFFGQVLAGFKDVAKRTIITNFVGTPGTMLFTVVLVAAGAGLWGYIFAQVASAVLVLGLLLAVMLRLLPARKREFPVPPRSGFPALPREVVFFSAAAFGVSFLEFAMAQADKVLIGVYLNAHELGVYSVAAALVAFVPVVLQSVNQIFSPMIADLHARHQQVMLGRIFQTLTKWILGSTIPLVAGMVLFAPQLMGMFGPDFRHGWPILVIGAIGQLVNCAAGSVGYLLLMSGQQRRLVQIQAVVVSMIVLVNFTLVPRWGLMGAATGAALANIMTNVCYLSAVRKSLGLFPYNRSYLRMAAPVLGTMATLLIWRYFLGMALPGWALALSGVLLAYGIFVSLAMRMGLDEDDRLILQAVRARLGRAIPRMQVGL
jgi:O-antigen/teichoic acid export membrane protein